jgi:GNAT superfamily N-acetyltransferase
MGSNGCGARASREAEESMNVTVRVATEADTALILRLIKGLAEYERLADQVMATEDVLRASLFGPRPDAEVLIASAGEDAVGFALFFHNYSTFLAQRGLYLEDLFVVPEWRRHGVGRLLLTHLARIAIERNCGRLEWAVLDWNAPAIRFYQALGAKPMHDWTIFRLTGDALHGAAAEPEVRT